MASAYHAPLAGSLFIAEILFGTLMLASLGPVVISAVIALLVTQLINGGASPLYQVEFHETLTALHYALMLATGLLAGLCGPLFIAMMSYSHRCFTHEASPPWQLALGGMIVGLLSLVTPAVWVMVTARCSIICSHRRCLAPSRWSPVCKLFAVLASSGSGAPGGVFTPTLFVGLAMGMLFASFSGLWLHHDQELAIMIGLTGMATFLAATTRRADYVDIDDSNDRAIPVTARLIDCQRTGIGALPDVTP